MPYKPKKPCAVRNCPELTHNRFCDEHAKQEAHRYNRYQRDPESKKHYGASWKKIRDAFLSANPVCEECLKQGKIVPAETVHHIKPLAEGGTHAWDNLQSLCTSHHSSLHLRERGKE